MIMLLADAVPPPRQEGGPQGEKKWIMLESFDSPHPVFQDHYFLGVACSNGGAIPCHVFEGLYRGLCLRFGEQ